MSSDAASDQDSSDGYVQRAELLADLGRYDEAAAELGYAVALEPGNARALTVLARVHLAAQRPAEALSAAQAAVAAAPALVEPLVVRGLALADLRRFAEAAATAEQILALGPDDGYAQRSGAAILAEARNGQPALDAAWRGVRLAPEEPQAHLVLGLVSARLGLFSLAERAYREALQLDPRLAEAQHDLGVIRLEQRRYAQALEDLAEAAAMRPEAAVIRRAEGGGVAGIGGALRRFVLYGAGYCLVAAVIIAFVAAGNVAVSRVWAALAAIAGAVVLWGLAARVPAAITKILPGLLRTDRSLALSVYAVAAALCLLLLYALVGTPWPLVLAIGATGVAELAVLSRGYF